jgi:hypothetical protein
MQYRQANDGGNSAFLPCLIWTNTMENRPLVATDAVARYNRQLERDLWTAMKLSDQPIKERPNGL